MEISLVQIIEALLFASDSPLTVQRIKDILEDRSAKDIRDALNKLKRTMKNPEVHC